LTDVWIAVAAIGLATVCLKGAGPVLAGARELPGPLARVVPLLAPALLAALVATQTLGQGRRLVIDERAAGLAAAVIPVVLRAPVLVTVAVAAGVTAGLRALG
jgi:branched-subunit amino acid transport protein